MKFFHKIFTGNIDLNVNSNIEYTSQETGENVSQSFVTTIAQDPYPPLNNSPNMDTIASAQSCILTSPMSSTAQLNPSLSEINASLQMGILGEPLESNLASNYRIQMQQQTQLYPTMKKEIDIEEKEMLIESPFVNTSNIYYKSMFKQGTQPVHTKLRNPNVISTNDNNSFPNLIDKPFSSNSFIE